MDLICQFCRNPSLSLPWPKCWRRFDQHLAPADGRPGGRTEAEPGYAVVAQLSSTLEAVVG